MVPENLAELFHVYSFCRMVLKRRKGVFQDQVSEKCEVTFSWLPSCRISKPFKWVMTNLPKEELLSNVSQTYLTTDLSLQPHPHAEHHTRWIFHEAHFRYDIRWTGLCLVSVFQRVELHLRHDSYMEQDGDYINPSKASSTVREMQRRTCLPCETVAQNPRLKAFKEKQMRFSKFLWLLVTLRF